MNKNDIEMMFADGFSVRKIAQMYNLSFSYVAEIIKEHKYSIKKEIFTKDKVEKIITLYNNGVSAKNLGIKYSISKSHIFKWAKAAGTLRTLEHSHRLHNVDEHMFDSIDTPEKAYWLGFLYADAYNYEKKGWITLALQEKDLDHIYKFVYFMKGSKTSVKYIKATKAYTYKINSKYLSKVLHDKGCPQAKSFIINYPTWLSKDLNFHFIRGYFDGDGCLTSRSKQQEYKWSIVGTREFCEKVNELFKELNINLTICYISQTNNNTYELQSSGNLKIQKICDQLYNNSTIHMERKYKKYLDLIELNKARHGT